MKKGVSFAAALLAAAVAPVGACTTTQQGSQPATSSGAPAGAERMSTQLKSADGTTVANATFDFANGYAMVTVDAGPNQVLTPGSMR
jgi:superoxide dismutase, Cu-Zn family